MGAPEQYPRHGSGPGNCEGNCGFTREQNRSQQRGRERLDLYHSLSSFGQRSMARETILIVEDNDVLRQGLQALLEAEGYSVSTAVHGSDALEIMRSIHPDIAMPEMD